MDGVLDGGRCALGVGGEVAGATGAGGAAVVGGAGLRGGCGLAGLVGMVTIPEPNGKPLSGRIPTAR